MSETRYREDDLFGMTFPYEVPILFLSIPPVMFEKDDSGVAAWRSLADDLRRLVDSSSHFKLTTPYQKYSGRTAAMEDVDAVILFPGWPDSNACVQDKIYAQDHGIPIFNLVKNDNGVMELQDRDGDVIETCDLYHYLYRLEYLYRFETTGTGKKQRSEAEPDNVNHPSHYKIGEYECFTEMRALFGIDALISYCKLAVYKYRYRFTKKNGDEDLKKAGWYMRELMKLEEEKAAAE